MVWRVLVQSEGEKLPQRKGVGQTPGDAALAVETLEEPDRHDAEVQTWGQRRTSQFGMVKGSALIFAELVETSLVENRIQTDIERVAGRLGQLATGVNPKSETAS